MTAHSVLAAGAVATAVIATLTGIAYCWRKPRGVLAGMSALAACWLAVSMITAWIGALATMALTGFVGIICSWCAIGLWAIGRERSR